MELPNSKPDSFDGTSMQGADCPNDCPNDHPNSSHTELNEAADCDNEFGGQFGNDLIDALSPFISPLGYRIIHAALQSGRQRTLRIYIDFIQRTPGQNIGIEDCAKVSRALDEPFETNLGLQKLISGSFELEVSSPGMDRPLRTPQDYLEFAGEKVRIHTFRPLNAEELKNPGYQLKNPKQKHFLGKLLGFKENRVEIETTQDENLGKKKKNKKVKTKVEGNTNLEKSPNEEGRITIPIQLISKANLEPVFSFEENEERE